MSDQIVQTFIEETEELLAELEGYILDLELDASNSEGIHSASVKILVAPPITPIKKEPIIIEERTRETIDKTLSAFLVKLIIETIKTVNPETIKNQEIIRVVIGPKGKDSKINEVPIITKLITKLRKKNFKCVFLAISSYFFSNI